MCACQTFSGKKCQGAECWGDIPLATVTFDTNLVHIPREVILPLPVANQSRSTRKIILNEPTMQLPVPIVEWIANHGTYHDWLVYPPEQEVA
jgi:hypothetical protein